jgi:hypothetical protein
MILYLDTFVSGTITGPNNALGAPDNVFTTNVDNEDWEANYVFPNAPDVLEGVQTLTFRVRKQTGDGNPTLNMYVTENLQSLHQLPSLVVTSLTGQDYVGTFTPVDPTAQIGLYMTCTAVGGNPAQRAAVQLDAVTFDASLAVFQGSKINAWGGSSWVSGRLKRWDGAEWTPAQVQRWNGSIWENVP